MSEITRIVLRGIGILFALALLCGAVWWGYRMTPTSDACVALFYEIEDADERAYVGPNELNALLRSEDIYPVGRPIDRVSLQRIENAVRHHPMVRTAECFATPRHQVYVRLTQRVPLVRVQTAAETYLIDTDRRQMQARASVKDSVLRVTGAIGVKTAATQMADFAEWLQDNPYWSERINHIHMRTPRMAVVCLKKPLENGQTPVVILGTMNGYERKLKKLRTFIENSSDALKDKQYSELDLRFRGQVIGRRAVTP